MAEVDMLRRWDDVDPILLQGDGSALFAIQWNRLNPMPPGGDPFSHQWARVDAVAAYKRSVSTWRDDGTGEIVENRDAARKYRFEHPGCSFAEVQEHVAVLNLRDGDGG